MNLPNYFLADLPPEAVLGASMLEEACLTLKRNREKYLAGRSTHALVEILSEVGANWLRPDYAIRKLALELGPGATGFSVQTLTRGLESFFRQLDSESLTGLLVQDLGSPKRLDHMTAGGAPHQEGPARSATVTGPELIFHIAAGNIPNPAMTSIVLGLLTRSAQFVKCASGASLLPRLFAHSLYEAERKLGACLEIAEWPGGNAELERGLFDAADCVTAAGSDETLADIRRRVPGKARFLGYGDRVSFGYIAAGGWSPSVGKIAERAATDVVAWNQLGCLSPHVIYVEQGGRLAAEPFAELLAQELARREETEPRGELPRETAATIASRRAIYEVRAAHSPETRFWQSHNSTAWTVVYESDPLFQLSCLNRFIYVKSVSDLKTALESADSVRGKVSTVGLAASEEEAPAKALELARWGATRICPLGQMQNPPLTWRHDGRPALGELVTWTDWEHS
ncbi:MAG TPA: acyl-CoA reductase [Verrucomicrobiae bacterium]|nr:acyl-CoA reductase [Verrucomicrobiae bacterium]